MADGRQEYAEYYYGTYLRGMAEARVELYQWQNHANEVLLWFVCGLALSGVALAALQLCWSFWLERTPEQSTVETSATGIKITSPFVGIAILFLSFSFFLLFVREVYTIRVEATATSTAQAQAPAALSGGGRKPAIQRSDEHGY